MPKKSKRSGDKKKGKKKAERDAAALNPTDDAKAQAAAFKEQSNVAFKAGDYKEAVRTPHPVSPDTFFVRLTQPTYYIANVTRFPA